MAFTATTNLSLPLIDTGTESGTWGELVDNGLTSYLDIAIAGGLAIAITSADVTLTKTAGTSSATGIISTGATGSTAQYAILNISGAKTANRNLILPVTSKWYIINNAGTGAFTLTVKGAATTGVTLQNGEKCIVAWNGTDYVKVAGWSTTNNASYTQYLTESSTSQLSYPTLRFERTGALPNGTAGVGYIEFWTNGPGSIGTYQAGSISVRNLNSASTAGVGSIFIGAGNNVATFNNYIDLGGASGNGTEIAGNNTITFTIVNSTAPSNSITADGYLKIGTTSAGAGIGASAALSVYESQLTTAYTAVFRGSNLTIPLVAAWSDLTTGNPIFHTFGTEATFTSRGTIDYNRAGGLVRYNTTSDATLKNIIGNAPQSKSLEILDSTVLREYSWKDDATNKAQIGVIAQELYTTFPGAVSVGGDYEVEVKAVLDDEGNIVTPATMETKYRPWAVDKTAFTFHLIAGYQAQKAQIAALEARLTALEAKTEG